MKLAVLSLLALAASAEPRLFFSKSFPGSTPAYMEIRLARDGAIEYREAPDEADPILFRLKPAEADTVFALSDKLGHFDHELESGLKVARMGEKTLRWEDGAERREVKFNYSLDVDAQTIQDWFERMCESAWFNIQLERTVKYDRIGVNQILLKLEAAWDKKRLVGADQYLKMLDRVARQEAFVNMARERAAKLAEAIRNPPPPQPEAEKTGSKQ